MSAATVLTFLLISTVALAAPNSSTGRPPFGGGNNPGGPGGYGHKDHGPPGLGPILGTLTDAQRQELMNTFKSSAGQTKAEMQAKLDSFISTLTSEQQAQVAAEKQKIEEKKTKDAASVQKLSSEAQQLYNNVKAVADDSSLTFQAAHEKVVALVQAAGQSVVQEFKTNHIMLPGLRSPPTAQGGPQDQSSSEEAGASGSGLPN